MYVEIRVTLRLTVSQSICLRIEYPCGTCDQILFPVGMLLSEICGLVSVGSPLWREDGSVCTQLAPRLTRLSPITSDKYNWFCRLCFRLPAALLYVGFHCLPISTRLMIDDSAIYNSHRDVHFVHKQLRGLIPRAKYTNRATSVCWRS
jgi:hypothetical protein